jgi:hypothetical protein
VNSPKGLNILILPEILSQIWDIVAVLEQNILLGHHFFISHRLQHASAKKYLGDFMYQSTPTGAQTVTHTLIDALNHTE